MKVTIQLTADQVKHFQLLCNRFGYANVYEVVANAVE